MVLFCAQIYLTVTGKTAAIRCTDVREAGVSEGRRLVGNLSSFIGVQKLKKNIYNFHFEHDFLRVDHNLQNVD